MKLVSNISSLGLLTAIAASLCCITPILAALAGISGLASSFSWLEPARPYFIGTTILLLGFAWYQKLKPVPKDDCDCEVQKVSFFQTKSFLGIVTAFALLMLTFPSYAHIFYPSQEKEAVGEFDENNISEVEFEVNAMTCAGCERHIEHAVNELKGIIEVKASFKDANTIVKFNSTQTNLAEMEEAIKSTDYKVGESKIIE